MFLRSTLVLTKLIENPNTFNSFELDVYMYECFISPYKMKSRSRSMTYFLPFENPWLTFVISHFFVHYMCHFINKRDTRAANDDLCVGRQNELVHP